MENKDKRKKNIIINIMSRQIMDLKRDDLPFERHATERLPRRLSTRLQNESTCALS